MRKLLQQVNYQLPRLRNTTLDRPRLASLRFGQQVATLTASDGQSGDEMGVSVAISGNTVVAGTPWVSGGQSAAYVFVRPATGWVNMTQTAKLTPSDGSSIGSVSISGNTMVAATDYCGAAAYVFVEPPTG